MNALRLIKRLLDFKGQLKNKSINHQIFSAALTVALLTILVKAISLIKELITAWRFGIGDDLDAFLIALLVPSFVINVIANSFNAALIPTYIQVREKEGIKAAQRLFSGTIVWSIGLLVIATLLMLGTAPLYLPRIASGFSSEKLDLAFHLLLTIAPIILLNGVAQTWSAVLNAGERFALVALSPIITPTITIILLLIDRSLGVYMLVGGLVLGMTIEMSLVGITLKRQGMSLRPRWYGLDNHLRQVVSQYAPMVAGGLLICSTGIVDQSMAAMLMPGSVSTLSYGDRVISSSVSLMNTALSTAVIPYFSKMVANDNWAGIQHTFRYYLRLIFLTTIPLAGLLMTFSESIVRTLFQRGAFTASDTHLVAQVLTCFALQIPFYIANILAVRLVSSMGMNHVLARVSACNLLINIALNYIFMQWIGIKGIALSTSCVYMFSFSYIFILVRRKLKYNLSHISV